jgi:hypothetical protein
LLMLFIFSFLFSFLNSLFKFRLKFGNTVVIEKNKIEKYMDCKNTDNKYFFVGNVSVSLDDFSKLPDQTVDRVSVELPDILKHYQKKKFITVYNCTAEVIKNGSNVTPKNICLHCNLANPSNTSGVVDYSLFRYYRANPSACTCARCAGQANCNMCRTCLKCGDCNKCRDYADHSSCDVNKDIYNTM